KKLVIPIYESLRCRPDPEAWLQSCEEACACENCERAEQTVWGEYLLDDLHREVGYAADALREAIRLCAFDSTLSEKYVPHLLMNLEQTEKLCACTSWDEAAANRIQSYGTIPQARNCEKPEFKERVQSLRKSALKIVKDAGKFLSDGSSAVLADLRKCADAQRGLIRLLREFDRAYTQEKRRRKIFDFSDLEHETLRLLCMKADAKPTAAAREISLRFSEILVDEYQDSNEIQERIFTSISKNGENLFMVGDVKQSIYRFRMADPGIFMDKYSGYPGYEVCKGSEPRKILLSNNFRSRKQILQAVNDVFSLVMNSQSLELDYGEDEKLLCGAEYPDTPQPKVELHCIDLDIETSENEADANKSEEEARFVARRIRTLLDEKTMITENGALRPAEPGDIVILMRSPGTYAEKYQKALAEVGLCSVSDRGGSILDSTEVEVLCALLQIINNPHQDIPLITAMASPVFGFTPEELAQLRTNRREGDFYSCLLAEESRSEKLQRFLSWLRDTRKKSRLIGVAELVDTVIDQTGLEEVFSSMPDGSVRLVNVHTFRTLAQSFESSGSRSLMQFCAYLDNLRESGANVKPPEPASKRDCITIMSIHRSKGLEFPIVILSDLSHGINLQDSKAGVLSDAKLYFGTNVVHEEQRAFYASIAKQAISRKQTLQCVAEELRVLYVAMTRAKEMLIMTYCSGKLQSKLKKWNGALSEPLSPYVAASAGCLGDWILMAALCRTEAGELFAVSGPNDVSRVHDDVWRIKAWSAAELRAQKPDSDGRFTDVQPMESLQEEAEQTICFSYPFEACKSVPSKLTATQIKGRIPDLEAAENAEQPFDRLTMKWRKPDFCDARSLSGREKGSANHLFMQYVRYENCVSEELLLQELERLVQEQFLRPEQAAAVDLRRIQTLFSSEFGKRILRAKNLQREFKFSVMEDAGRFFPACQSEKIMLQGVVDCFWIEDDGIVIVDYKTDFIKNDLPEKVEKYRPQVTAYASALGRIFNCPVKEVFLYFFSAGQAVEII
ncbi:MAG: UvrD-helicase domain-containing protein, partial [Clostridia bacterium]|nr:UvrD-helicase domain-containing protein [Clostridia bacterium]